MIVVSTRDELRAARADLTGPVGVVMTMGALHRGHASLLRTARASSGSVIVTIFVNPTQFGPNEDYDQYPRTLDADLEICGESGADLVFVPSVAQMYPTGVPLVRIDPGPIGAVLEGASRPGFFNGVLTVVLKLLQLTQPDRAFFGEKDFQQLAVIRAMVEEFQVPVEVVGVATVREDDGLAYSSRNRYLSHEHRAAAVVLSRALRAGAAAGPGGAGAVLDSAEAVLATQPGVQLDYLALADPDLRVIATAPAALSDQIEQLTGGRARLLVAAKAGNTRLIDNVAVEIS